MTENIISKVSDWAKKWLEAGEINADVVEYVLNFKAQPAKNYGLIAVRFLGLISRSLRYILVDTTNFLRMLQEINKRFGPIPDHFLLVSGDIEAIYPSIDNALEMEACRKALENREKHNAFK